MLLSFLPDFLISRFSRKRGRHIDTLPTDIFVDHIFIFLTVEDILRLRRVSKLYYYLTQQPIIWKRFLRHLKVPIPPLPPTAHHSLASLAQEAERLVIRAISLDDNWRSNTSKTHRIHRLRAYHEIHEMAILPGGKYLVASADPGYRRYSIIIFGLDHAGGESVALARTPTQSKAYHLRAKYMTHEGIQGIAICYIRRKFRGLEQERDGVDPSDYSATIGIDSPFPLQYECVCLHVPLHSLEYLSSPKLVPGSNAYRSFVEMHPPPFLEVTRMRTTTPMVNPSLVENEGKPFIVIVKPPDKVIIKDLTRPAISTLECPVFEPFPEPEPTICNVQAFPTGQILVIRMVLPPFLEIPLYLFEVYRWPEYGTTTSPEPVQRYVIDHLDVADFYISDGHTAPHIDKSVHSTLAASRPPTPISIFCQATQPRHIHHYVIWPTQSTSNGSQSSKTYRYSLNNIMLQSVYDCIDTMSHVLPGAYRTVIYSIPSSDRRATPSVLELMKYITPEVKPPDYPESDEETEGEHDQSVIKRKEIPSSLCSSLALPEQLAASLRRYGVTAVAWDEGIGRVCISSAEDTTIYILDFAHIPTGHHS